MTNIQGFDGTGKRFNVQADIYDPRRSTKCVGTVDIFTRAFTFDGNDLWDNEMPYPWRIWNSSASDTVIGVLRIDGIEFYRSPIVQYLAEVKQRAAYNVAFLVAAFGKGSPHERRGKVDRILASGQAIEIKTTKAY